MELTSWQSWASLGLLLLAGTIAGVLPRSLAVYRRPRWTEGWPLPVLAGIAAAAIVRYVWGSWHPVPFIHDEASYLLEAQMLARGHFTAPPPALPAFFEQYHVFVTPMYASRYPLGWPLALVPGIWVGLPVLMPLLFTAATAGLLVAAVRRLAGPVAATCAWACWIAPPIALRFRPTYLSEHLSTFLWMVGFWALWRWRDERRTRWLVILAVAIGWEAITRPLTAIAFALPIGILVLRDTVRLRSWRPLAWALLAGTLVVGLVPLQDRAVTGRWDVMPMKLYSDLYAPFDLPGFGLDTRPPAVPISAYQKAYNNGFRPLHAQHIPSQLPAILAGRLRQFFAQSGAPWGAAGIVLFALVGVIAGGEVMAFAGLTATSLFVCYLWFAHPEHWLAYYMEAHLVFAAAVAIGARRVLEFAQRLAHRAEPDPRILLGRNAAAMLLLTAMVAGAVPGSVAVARAAWDRISAPNRAVDAIARQLPTPAILFIRYAPNHPLDRNFVENQADLAGAPLWRVHDLGAENAALIRLAPGRMPFLLDEGAGTVGRLAVDGVTLLPVARR